MGKPVLPTDPQERKGIPITTGVLDYFPAALAEVAKVSKAGNDQHNPGQPLHWARGKSTDQADTLVRHLMERGSVDTDGMRHSAKLAWRALALLQLELEEAGAAPVARGAWVDDEPERDEAVARSRYYAGNLGGLRAAIADGAPWPHLADSEHLPLLDEAGYEWGGGTFDTPADGAAWVPSRA